MSQSTRVVHFLGGVQDRGSVATRDLHFSSVLTQYAKLDRSNALREPVTDTDPLHSESVELNSHLTNFVKKSQPPHQKVSTDGVGDLW